MPLSDEDDDGEDPPAISKPGPSKNKARSSLAAAVALLKSDDEDEYGDDIALDLRRSLHPSKDTTTRATTSGKGKGKVKAPTGSASKATKKSRDSASLGKSKLKDENEYAADSDDEDWIVHDSEDDEGQLPQTSSWGNPTPRGSGPGSGSVRRPVVHVQASDDDLSNEDMEDPGIDDDEAEPWSYSLGGGHAGGVTSRQTSSSTRASLGKQPATKTSHPVTMDILEISSD